MNEPVQADITTDATRGKKKRDSSKKPHGPLSAMLMTGEVAHRMRCKPEKVITWILSDELRAINAATKLGGRARYLIDVADLAAFEAKRQVQPPSRRPARRKKRTDVIDFFESC